MQLSVAGDCHIDVHRERVLRAVLPDVISDGEIRRWKNFSFINFYGTSAFEMDLLNNFGCEFNYSCGDINVFIQSDEFNFDFSTQ